MEGVDSFCGDVWPLPLPRPHASAAQSRWSQLLPGYLDSHANVHFTVSKPWNASPTQNP